jgi:hypothetical protein
MNAPANPLDLLWDQVQCLRAEVTALKQELAKLPADPVNMARLDDVWVRTRTLTDAPTNGQVFGRNGQKLDWVQLSTGAFAEPFGAGMFGRTQTGNWQPIVPFDEPVGPGSFMRTSAGTWTPSVPLVEPVGGTAWGRTPAGGWAGVLPLTGGTLNNAVTINSNVAGGPRFLLQGNNPSIDLLMTIGTGNWLRFMMNPTTPRWQLGGNTSGLAGNMALTPFDQTGVQQPDAMFFTNATGLITVRADPTAALGIATKQYVDALGTGPFLPLAGGSISNAIQGINSVVSITNTETGMLGGRALTLSSGGSQATTPALHVTNSTAGGLAALFTGQVRVLGANLMIGSATGTALAGDVNISGSYMVNGVSLGTGPFLPLAGGTIAGTTTNALTVTTTVGSAISVNGAGGSIYANGALRVGFPIETAGNGAGDINVAGGYFMQGIPMIDGAGYHISDGVTLHTVQIGAADSGGTGFRALVVPN